MNLPPVRVAPARGSADLRRFIDLPWRLYAGDPCWVPPLRSGVRELLDEKHPFYAGGAAEREIFLARRGSRVVGRVVAVANHAYNAYHKDRTGFFGFFECEDDQAAALDLLAAAADWLRGKGCDVMYGPVSPSTNYEAGLLVEGFDTPPTVMMTYNPKRYQELVEQAGFEKAKDLYAYLSEVHPASLDRLAKLAERTSRRELDLVCRPADLKRFDAEAARIRDIYNSAWADNWGFVPASDAEFAALAKELRPLVDPDLVRVAFVGDDPAGFLLALPDVNPALAALDGSMWNPIRLVRATLIGRRKVGLRLITMGVKEQYRLRGIEGVMFYQGLRSALDNGYAWCEYSWILEDNELAKRTVRLMDAKLSKVYRIYARAL